MITTDILFLIFTVFIFSAGYAAWRAAPFAPTRKEDIKNFLKMVEIKPGKKFYDLGCGDGRLLISVAKKGANAIGYEISLFNYFLTKIKILFSKSNASVKFKDFWYVNLSDADIVYFFLMPKIYPKLKAKFEKELKKGTKVVAYVWPIEGWTPIKINKTNDKYSIYLYEI